MALACLVLVAACNHDRISPDAATVQATPPPPAALEPELVSTIIAEPPPPVVFEPLPLPPGPVKVALLLPLSGPSAEVGKAMFEAAQMAVFDVGNEDFELLPRDTRGTAEGAKVAVHQALAEGARLILGPLFSASVAAVTPLAQAAQVNVIAFSSDRSVARPGIYLIGFLPAEQVERVVLYALGRGYERFTALAPETPFGQSMVNELARMANFTGAVFVPPEFYPATLRAASEVEAMVRRMTDYDYRRRALAKRRKVLEQRDDDAARAELDRLEGEETLGGIGFDAVLLPDGGQRLLTVAPMFAFFDADASKARLLGTAQWDSVRVVDEPALHGAWFAAPDPQGRASFETRFAASFGRSPPRVATLAYDAVALAGALAGLPGGQGFAAATLAAPVGFRGVDGLFRFNADGTAERGLAVLEVTADGIIIVDPAPQTFGVF